MVKIEEFKEKDLPSPTILFSSEANFFSLSVVGYELIFKPVINEYVDIPTHCEIFFRDLGIISASFPIVKIKKPSLSYLYFAVNPEMPDDEVKIWKHKLIERLGSPYDFISLFKYLPFLKSKLEKVPPIGYNCITLFSGLVNFDVQDLTVKEFLEKLYENGWKIYKWKNSLLKSLLTIVI